MLFLRHCLPSSFWDRFSHCLRTGHVGWTGWPSSPWNLPISASLALGLQAHWHHTQLFLLLLFCGNSRDVEVLMFAKQRVHFPQTLRNCLCWSRKELDVEPGKSISLPNRNLSSKLKPKSVLSYILSLVPLSFFLLFCFFVLLCYLLFFLSFR